MGIFDGGFKLGTGLTVGIATVILAPVVVPVVAGIVKPVVKATIKGGILLYDSSRRMIAGAAEMLEDLAAEAKAEVEAENISEVPSTGETVEETA